ncbi:MAG TPA: hypothetical protein DDX39_10015 [Bacteroidales bacterium]|nr:MAG: hypothetical protein A2W98_01360 [Bacteroidetes bacterium GWF2_33_38]OFY75185.1 MAG: hypothetical protein A2265_05220 [Bacteroidetes bacterium RIFOXYA12_FULL_33_9]OFY88979.1 MAG: hypothetical protein A2236_04305 [Bacteroidetes bacterium RIFOXYA2_FULL_33_7]HBF88965.1 hypothetical protein [Bacteroidales bacterium]
MKAVGIISIIIGGLSALQSLMSILIIGIEDMIFSKIPNEIFTSPNIPFDMPIFIHQVAKLIYVFMPIQIIIGVIFIFAGIKLVNKKAEGIIHIRFASLFQIVWYVAYSIVFYQIFTSLFTNMFSPILDTRFFDTIYIISIFIGGIFTCGFPIFNLIFFRKHSWKINS